MMQLNLDDDEAIDVLEMVGDIYSDLLLQHQMHQKGMKTASGNSAELTEELLFKCAKVMLKISKQCHEAKLCACENDDGIKLQEQVFNKMFKKKIELNQWWTKQFLSRGPLPLTLPQSPTSGLTTQKDESKWRPEPNKPSASDEER